MVQIGVLLLFLRRLHSPHSLQTAVVTSTPATTQTSNGVGVRLDVDGYRTNPDYGGLITPHDISLQMPHSFDSDSRTQPPTIQRPMVWSTLTLILMGVIPRGSMNPVLPMVSSSTPPAICCYSSLALPRDECEQPRFRWVQRPRLQDPVFT
jgi:hypothetical protein